MRFVDKDLLSVQEARILMENAGEARKVLAGFEQERLDRIVVHMAQAAAKHARELAVMSCEETEYGNWQDKYRKNRYICEYLPEKLKTMRFVGIISEDREEKMMKVGVPLGIIAALTPSTNPVSTAIYQALIAMKSGNAIVFAPHERAAKTTGRTLDILMEAAAEAGLPDGALSYLGTVTRQGTEELIGHPAVSLVIGTGVPEMTEVAKAAGKPFIYGGTVGSPAFIERTADIPKAVKAIMASRNFDYGIVPAAEQYIVADSRIAGEAKREFERNGAYFMSGDEEKQLIGLLCPENGSQDPELVGKPARELARRAGFSVPDTVKVLVSEQKYISDRNPYARALLCPVLVYYIENDWVHACEKCIELLANESHGHTLVIHSKDEEVIRQFALKKPVARMLVNTPAVFGSMGVTTNLFPAMTLGSITAGVGITSDSVSPMNLIYVRNVGYGVREIEDRMAGDAEERNGRADAAVLSTTCQTAVPKGGDDSLDDELERAMKKLLEWMAEEE